MSSNLTISSFLTLLSINELLPLFIMEYKKTITRKGTLILSSLLVLTFFLAVSYPIYAQYSLIFYSLLRFYLIKKRFNNWLAPSLSFFRDNILFSLSWFIFFDSFDALSQSKIDFNVQILLQILSLLLSYIVISMIYKQLNIIRGLKLLKKKYFWSSFSFLTIYLFFISIHRYYIIHYNISLFVLSLLLAITSGLFFIVCLFFLSYNNNLINYNSFLNNALNSINENYERIETFQHDYKNILLSISKFIEYEDIAGLNQYIAEISSYSSEYISSNNEMELLKINNYAVQSVLADFVSKVELNEQYFDLNLNISKGNYYLADDVIDVIRCVTILLNNILEEKTEHLVVEVYINIYSIDNTIFFDFKNSTTSKVSIGELQRKYFSKKENHSGLGLYIIRKIISQHNNFDYYVEIDDNFFYSKLIIS